MTAGWRVLVVLRGETLPESYEFATFAEAREFARRVRTRVVGAPRIVRAAT